MPGVSYKRNYRNDHNTNHINYYDLNWRRNHRYLWRFLKTVALIFAIAIIVNVAKQGGSNVPRQIPLVKVAPAHHAAHHHGHGPGSVGHGSHHAPGSAHHGHRVTG